MISLIKYYLEIYLTNPSLRSALFSPVPATDDRMGNLVETAILAQWLHRDWHTPYDSRWKEGEVDMVGLSEKDQKPIWAVEVKWSNQYFHNPGKLRNLIKFCQKNNLSNALVTTIDKSGSATLENVHLHFLPAAAHAYTVGRNTFKPKTEMD